MASWISVGWSSLLAHQGGWDEILLIAVPILLIGGALRVAKRRVDALAAAGRSGDDEPGAPSDDRSELGRGIANGDDSLVE